MESNSAKSRSLLFPLVLSLLAVLLYAKTSSFDFAYDDIMRIHYNPLVNAEESKGLNLEKILNSPAPPGNLFRPVSTLSFRLNFLISGAHAGSYHLVNILLFAFCVFFVAQIFLWLLPSTFTAYAAALIFTVHPICTESVANIVGRQELLAAGFGLLALYLIKQALESSKSKSLVFLSLSLASFFLAIHSKESAYTFAGVIPAVLYLAIPADDPKKWAKIRKVFFGLIATTVICLLLRYQVLGEQLLIKSNQETVFFENPMFHLSFSERIWPGLFLLGKYMQLIFFPIHLSANYAIQPELFFAEVYSLKGFLSIFSVFLLLFFIVRFKRKSWASFGLWFFLAFSLTLNLITPIGTIMGERLAFLPSIGLIGFTGGLVFQVSKYFKSFRGFVLLFLPFVVGAFAGKSFVRIDAWQNHASIYKATVIDAPYSPKAAFNLGIHYLARENNLDLAKSQFQRAVELAPDYEKAMHLLLKIAEEQKDQQAIKLWSKRIQEIKD